jgi:predicted metal-binding membrane protein
MTSTGRVDAERSGHMGSRQPFPVVALLVAVSAAVTIALCRSMSSMGDMAMPGGWTMSMIWMAGRSWPGAASFLGMWVVMMTAMMLPSILPMLEGHCATVGTTAGRRLPALAALVGVGYLFVWTVIGMAALPLGVGLAVIEMREPALARAVPITAALVIIAAGAVQFSNWKARHLACWQRPGSGPMIQAQPGSAWRYGLSLGVHCVQCCGNLMAILLVMGVMDLRAMALVTVAIHADRLVPGDRIARAIGAGAIAAGLLLIGRIALRG